MYFNLNFFPLSEPDGGVFDTTATRSSSMGRFGDAKESVPAWFKEDYSDATPAPNLSVLLNANPQGKDVWASGSVSAKAKLETGRSFRATDSFFTGAREDKPMESFYQTFGSDTIGDQGVALEPLEKTENKSAPDHRAETLNREVSGLV